MIITIISIVSSIVGGIIIALHIKEKRATWLCHRALEDFYFEVDRLLALLRKKDQLQPHKDEYIESSRVARRLYKELMRLLIECHCPKHRRVVNHFWIDKISGLCYGQQIPIWDIGTPSDNLVDYSDWNAQIYRKTAVYLNTNWFCRWVRYKITRVIHPGLFVNKNTKKYSDFMVNYQISGDIKNSKGEIEHIVHLEERLLRGYPTEDAAREATKNISPVIVPKLSVWGRTMRVLLKLERMLKKVLKMRIKISVRYV